MSFPGLCKSTVYRNVYTPLPNTHTRTPPPKSIQDSGTTFLQEVTPLGAKEGWWREKREGREGEGWMGDSEEAVLVSTQIQVVVTQPGCRSLCRYTNCERAFGQAGFSLLW